MNGPKFRLVSDGKHTYFELCGKSIGVVDGVNIKADTWYTFKDGELVETED